MESLLNVIAMGEANKKSPHGEYGGMYSGIKNAPDVSSMTIGQVKAFQKQQIANGAKSSAAGRYQILNKSMDKYQSAAGLSDDDLFSPENQNLMVASFIKKRAGDNPERIADVAASEFASVKNRNGVGNYDGKLNKASIERSAIVNAVKQPDSFDPDAYLAQKTASTDTFDPDAYLAERAQPTAPVEQQAYSNNPFNSDFYNDMSLSNVPQNLGNLGAGLIRGAGSIGATALLPLDMASQKLRGDDFFSLKDNMARRQGIDGGLQAMGADTNSGLYATGKLGGEILGTADVGGVLAVGTKALKMYRASQVLKSGGFNLGAAKIETAAGSGAIKWAGNALANTTKRAAAGGAVGGTAAFAVNPGATGDGVAWGAALPAGGAAIAKVAGAVGSKLAGINDSDLAKIAIEKYGIPLSYANITNSGFMKSLRSVLNDAPLAGMAGQNQDAVQSAYNRGIGNIIGANSDSITEGVFNANKTRLEGNYSKVYGNNDLQLTPEVLGKTINELPKSGFLDNSNIPDNAYFTSLGGEKLSGGEGKTLLAEIRKMGGIALAEIRDILGEKTGKAAKAQVGLFKKAGVGIDDLASQLNDKGYIPADEMDFDGGVRYLKDAIRENVDGNKTYALHDQPFYAPEGGEMVNSQLNQKDLQNYFDYMQGDKVLSNNPLNKSMQAMRVKAKDLADPRQEANFNRVVDNLLAKADNGKVTGKQFNNWQSNLRTEIESKKGYEKALLNELRQASLKHFNDGVSKADKALLATTNQQYKASKTIGDLVTKGEANVAGRKEGDIPAALLSQAVAKNYKGGVKDSPFGELVKIGNKYIADRVIKTGGGQRAAIQGFTGTAGAAGLYINPVVTALVASGGITLNKLLGSPKLAKLMVKKNLNKLENAELAKQVKNKELYKQLTNAAVVTNAQ